MMQRLRLLVLGIVGFLGVFFAHGSWLNRLLAFTLCGVLSADSGLCMAQIAKFSGQANATTPILLSQRSSEFDDPPNTPPVNTPSTNTPAPFPFDAGPNFIRPEFGSNPNPILNNPTLGNNPVLALQPPSIQQIAPNTYEVSWNTPNGCSAVTTIKKEQEKVYQESIRFISSDINICGLPSFTSHVNSEGNRIEVQVLGDEKLYIVELLDNRAIKIIIRSSSGEREFGTFSKRGDKHNKVKDKILNSYVKQQNNNELRTEALCTAGRRVCAGISKIGDVAAPLSFLASAEGLGGIITAEAVAANAAAGGIVVLEGTGLAMVAPALLAITATALLASLGCYIMFGGAPPFNLFRGAEKILVAQAVSQAYGSVSAMGSLIDESEASNNPGIRAPAHNPMDQVLANFRRENKIDWCDKKTENVPILQPSPNPSTSPTQPTQSNGRERLCLFVRKGKERNYSETFDLGITPNNGRRYGILINYTIFGTIDSIATITVSGGPGMTGTGNQSSPLRFYFSTENTSSSVPPITVAIHLPTEVPDANYEFRISCSSAPHGVSLP